MTQTCMYNGKPVVDMDGTIVTVGSLLRFKHPKMGLKYSWYLYPVYLYAEKGYCLTYDDFVVTSEYLKQANLYVFSHINDYNGNLKILDDSHILSLIKEEQ